MKIFPENYTFEHFISPSDSTSENTMAFQCYLVPTTSQISEINAEDIYYAMGFLFDQEDCISDFVDYNDYDLQYLVSVLGFDVRVITPVILTQKQSPIEILLKYFGEPESLVEAWPYHRCVVAIWNSASTSTNYEFCKSESRLEFILNDAISFAKHNFSNLMIACSPGWSYESVLKYDFQEKTKLNLKSSGMIYTERFC